MKKHVELCNTVDRIQEKARTAQFMLGELYQELGDTRPDPMIMLAMQSVHMKVDIALDYAAEVTESLKTLAKEIRNIEIVEKVKGDC